MATMTVPVAATGVLPQEVQQVQRLHLKLTVNAAQLDPSAALAQVVDRLYAIQDRHFDSNDYLSRLLHEWINTVLQVNVEMIESHADNHQFIEEAKCLIRYLRETILVDPLYGRPLTEPVLEEGWVWDHPFLTAYQNTSLEIFRTVQDSPLSQKPLTAVNSHAFARAILEWIATLPDELLLPTLSEIESASAAPAGAGAAIEQTEKVLVVLPVDPKDMPCLAVLLPPPEILESLPADTRAQIERLFVQCLEERQQKLRLQFDNFIIKAKSAIIARKHEIMRIEAEKTNECFESTKAARAALYEEEVRARKEMAQAHSSLVTSNITAMRAAHTGEIAISDMRYNDLLRNFLQTRVELQEAHATIGYGAERIAVLERRNRDYEHQLGCLRSQENSSGGCIIM